MQHVYSVGFYDSGQCSACKIPEADIPHRIKDSVPAIEPPAQSFPVELPCKSRPWPARYQRGYPAPSGILGTPSSRFSFFRAGTPAPPPLQRGGTTPPWFQYQKVCFAWSARCDKGVTSPLRHKGEGYPPSLKKRSPPTPLVDQKWGGGRGRMRSEGIPTRIQQRGCITVFWCTTYGSLNQIL